MLNTPSQTPEEEAKVSFLFPIIATVLASLFVWTTFIFSRQEQRVSLPPDSITKLNPTILKPVTRADLERNVANHEVSSIAQVPAEIIAEQANPNRKIISPKSPEDFEKISAIVEQAGGKILDTNQSTLVIELPESTAQTITDELLANEGILSLETDTPTFVLAETDTWNIAKIEAPRAWQITKGQGVKVGIIDTGIDYTHPELIGRYIKGYDSVAEDNDPMDVHGHGTHVAGILAGNLNSSGIAGAAPEVSLYAYKAIADNGVGYVSDMIEALDHAQADGMQVINMSIGTSSPVSALENKILELTNRGITVIAAAGNTNGGTVMYPAAYEEVISVTATDENDQLASFSSLGGEIAAPGVNIISTLPGGRYGTMSGTSMAAPHVAATVALLIAKGETNPKQTLLASAYDLGSIGIDGIYGYGRLQTGDSIAPASPSPTPTQPSPTPTLEPSPNPTLEPSPALESTPSGDREISTKSAEQIKEKQSSDSSQIRRRSSFGPNTDSQKLPKLEEVAKKMDDNNSKAARTIYRIIEEIFKNQTQKNNLNEQQSSQTSPTPAATPSTTPTPSPTTTSSPEESVSSEDKEIGDEDEYENDDNESENNKEDESNQNNVNSQNANPSRSGSVRGWSSRNLPQQLLDLIYELIQLVF